MLGGLSVLLGKMFWIYGCRRWFLCIFIYFLFFIYFRSGGVSFK